MTTVGFAVLVLPGWRELGRQWTGLAELLSGPIYMARKLPLYPSFLKGRKPSGRARTGGIDRPWFLDIP